MNNRLVGKSKEELAGEYLSNNNIKNLEYNFRCKIGEIDIIGYDDDTIVIFEVKYRKTNVKGYAAEAVNYKKQQKICRVFDYYRMIHRIPESTSVRFDVIAIDGDSISWIKNAFEYIFK